MLPLWQKADTFARSTPVIGNAAVAGSVRQRLEDSLDGATAAGRAVAAYMLAHLAGLPFETSRSLAEKVGVSELTVGRFCRALGYRHFKDLKADLERDLGDSPWLIGDRLKAFRERRRNAGGEDTRAELARSLELEIAALVRVYELAQAPEWEAVVHRLATAPRVYVAGFQTERGVAAILVHLLQYLRDGVALVDVAGGQFAEVLLAPPGECALVVFEARRYSRQARLLCERARGAGVPVTLVTDPYCDWGRAAADEVFQVPTQTNLFWDNTAPMVSLVQLLVNGVFAALGPDVEARLTAFSGLYNDFVGHSGQGPREKATRPRGR